jgi:purine-binding chemotaxis protein CheW
MESGGTALRAWAGEEATVLLATFYIRDVHCALPALAVQEVIRPGRNTLVPHGPDCVVGIINLRGKIVTLVDLARKLELGSTEGTEDTRALIVEWKGEFVGLLVDRVSDVREIRPDSISPPPANVRGAQGRFLEGVHEAEGKLLAVLSVEEVLSDEDR